MTEDNDRQGRTSRTRKVLAAVLALLVLVLGVLGWFIVRVLAPAGAPKAGSLPPGLVWVRSIYGFGPSANQRFSGVAHTAIAPDGTIWASDGPHARVLGFNPDGSFKAVLQDPGNMVGPSGIAVGENGDVYVADYASSLIEVYANGGGAALRRWQVRSPLQVAVRGSRVAVTAIDGVHIFTSDGQQVAKWSSRGTAPDQLDLAQGIVIGDDGTIYISDTHNARVKAFTPAGKLLWVGPPGATSTRSYQPSQSELTTASPLQIPAGMTMDSAGRLVLVDPFSFQIVVLNPAQKGAIVGRYGDFGKGDGFFAYPTGISYDSSRDWFAVADTANNRVQIVRIPGSSNSGLLQALRRAASGPVWICAIPLLLLLLAIAVYVSGRRREREERATEPLDNIPSE